jgi:serine/threonine-protein kinase
MVEVCGHHLHTKPVPPSQRIAAPIPSDLEHIVLDCLEKDPAFRPASALELQRRLARCADAGTWTEADAEAVWSTRPASFDPASSGERTLRETATLQVAFEDRSLA